MLVIESVVFDR